MKVVFVVLHYCQINVTIDCINSLLRLNGNPQIVVVDNASPDESGRVLEEKYQENYLVHIILNDTNLGFATANNIGYDYAKNNLGADLIIIINNDTLIKDEKFIEKLISSPLVHNYHIVAPDIINKNGAHQNPFMLQPMSYDEVCKNYQSLGFLRIIYSIPFIGDIKTKYSLVKNKMTVNNWKTVQEMIVPHGAAIIYTPLWIKNEVFAFYPGTFMYVEEIILYYYVIAHNYKTIYTPDFSIYHLEDISTNTRFKNKRKKALFQTKEMRNSYKILIDYIKQNGLDYV